MGENLDELVDVYSNQYPKELVPAIAKFVKAVCSSSKFGAIPKKAGLDGVKAFLNKYLRDSFTIFSLAFELHHPLNVFK